MNPHPTRAVQGTCITVGLILPTVATWGYFAPAADGGTVAQQIALVGGKAIQLLLLVVWMFGIRRLRPRWGNWRSPQMKTGLLFGFVIAGLMVIIYHGWLKSTPLIDDATAKVQDKIVLFAGNSTIKYLCLAIFYCLVHSLFEEFYWRWFIFGQLREMTQFVPAVVLSSLGFMSHHVIVLGTFFGWTSPATYFFSLSVAVGGAVWAWLYERSGSLLPSWASHLLIDAGIFVIGYDMARPLFG